MTARSLRPLALLALFALLPACAEADRAVDDVASQVREAVSEAAEQLDDALPTPGSGPREPAQGDGEQTPGGAPGQPGDGQAPARTPVDDLGRVGANGPAFLRPDHPRLVVEVDVQQGLQPDGAALDRLVAVLEAHVDKPGGVVRAGGNTFGSDRTAWSTQDLRAAAAANRSQLSSHDQVVVYVLYVRGSFEEETALGVAHNASEVAVFPERWRGQLSQLLGGDSAVERAVLVHEMGHLFGLVNLTYSSRFDREDPQHPGHSRNRGSVMHWAIETTAIGQVFNGPPPDEFDEHDRADLERLRADGG